MQVRARECQIANLKIERPHVLLEMSTSIWLSNLNQLLATYPPPPSNFINLTHTCNADLYNTVFAFRWLWYFLVVHKHKALMLSWDEFQIQYTTENHMNDNSTRLFTIFLVGVGRRNSFTVVIYPCRSENSRDFRLLYLKLSWKGGHRNNQLKYLSGGS